MTHANQFNNLTVCLATMAGHSTHEFCDGDLRIVSLSAGLLSGADKVRLRMLEAIGDNAITLALAAKCFSLEHSVQTYQDIRSIVTTNKNLARVFVAKGFTEFVAFAAGVSSTGKAGANAFEAFVGLIYAELGMNGVISFCNSVELFDSHFTTDA